MDTIFVEGIRTSKNSHIQVISLGDYDEKAIERVISVLQYGLERGVYSVPNTQEN